jgi:hypothetical protein
MNIEELTNKHWALMTLDYDDNIRFNHTKLSIEFAISVLEELHETISYFGDTWWELQKIEEKIQELKTYLDEN